jgi:hypothetical protein
MASLKWVFSVLKGQTALVQVPNLPLVTFIMASVLTRIFVSGSANYLFRVVAFGSIFTWAWLEISTGINYFRRLLGLIVLGLSIMSAIAFLQALK